MLTLTSTSGCGKSTTASLIERFYDPIRGVIELDGINLKDINIKHLRGLIGYVGQEPVLFAATIAENIKHGNPKATLEQIEAAACLANAHSFIASFPNGYNTQVGDRGLQLSGGAIFECVLSISENLCPSLYVSYCNRAKATNCNSSHACRESFHHHTR